MARSNHPVQDTPVVDDPDRRVTTLISCPGVTPLRHDAALRTIGIANENRWFDRMGFRRRIYANAAAGLVAVGLLLAGIWIMTEFARLQKIAACFEAGRQNCMPLDMARRTR